MEGNLDNKKAHLAHCKANITELPMFVVNQVGSRKHIIMGYITKINVFGGMVVKNVEKRFPEAFQVIGK